MQNSPLWRRSFSSHCSGSSCARLERRLPCGQGEERPDSIEPDFFTHSGRSFDHWQSPACYERPRKVRHSAVYSPANPANWPGRQYTNLCWFIASGRSWAIASVWPYSSTGAPG